MFDCIHVSIFLFSKNCFKSLLDTSSTLGGSIEKVPVSSIASRQLGRLIELLFLIWWFVARHMLDTCICRQPFSRHFNRLLDTSRHLHLSRFTDGLYILLVRSAYYFCRSFSQYFCLSSPKPFSLNPNLFPKGFSCLIKFLLTWYVSNPSFSCISFSKT